MRPSLTHVRSALIVAAAISFALIWVLPAGASERHPTLSELEGQIMCPTCHTTLDQSNSLEAHRIERYISERIAAGDTESEIKAKLVAQFGEAILAAPPRQGWDLVFWWLPIAGVLVGGAVLGIGAWRWSHIGEPARTDDSSPPLDPELERRLDEELARMP